MNIELNPVIRRLERTTVILLVGSSISFFSYSFLGEELFLWRGIAFTIAVALLYFLLHPLARGVRKGDVVFVNIWREIDTPTMSDSYLDNVPTIALENGRPNQRIKVQLWDGSHGIVQLLNYGIVTPIEGRLIEAELTPPTTPRSTHFLDEEWTQRKS